MNYIYPTYDGKKHEHKFLNLLSELDLPTYRKWLKLHKTEKSINEKVEKVGANFFELSKQLTVEKFNKRKASEKKLMLKINDIKKEIQKLEQRKRANMISQVSLFTDVPKRVLLKLEMSPDKPKDDNHLETYLQKMTFLSTQTYEEEKVNSFTFQSETDETISNLSLELKDLRELVTVTEDQNKKASLQELYYKKKADLKKAESTVFNLVNIWEQSTVTNKDIQDMANDIITNMNEDRLDGLEELVAFISVEGSEEAQVLSKIKEGVDMPQYLEIYNQEFKKIYEHRLNVFKNQKKKLNLTTLLGVRNFFFINSETYSKNIKMSSA
jgi:septal ring factor EnvC (AmiA/AmiB activator)